MLMRENRTLNQRIALRSGFRSPSALSVAVRVVSTSYPGADLGLEGSLIAGILGGYVTGLASGVLISLPAMFVGRASDHAAARRRRRARRPAARPGAEPRRDLALHSVLRPQHLPLLQGEHEPPPHRLSPGFFAGILVAEFLRQSHGRAFLAKVVFPARRSNAPTCRTMLAIYAATLFAVAIPLKIWNNTRNEKKLEEQERLLVEARLAALTSQINPHFLFNTLN